MTPVSLSGALPTSNLTAMADITASKVATINEVIIFESLVAFAYGRRLIGGTGLGED